jgi:hypothetical protein
MSGGQCINLLGVLPNDLEYASGVLNARIAGMSAGFAVALQPELVTDLCRRIHGLVTPSPTAAGSVALQLKTF